MTASQSRATILEMAKEAKTAAVALAQLSPMQRTQALFAVAQAYDENRERIFAANRKDLEKAEQMVADGEISASLVQRLKLDNSKLDGIIDGIKQIALMPDPLNQTEFARELDEDLALYKVSAPIGLIAVVFESRPDALPQIVSLCLKSGNGVILKGGREAEHSNRLLFDLFKDAIAKGGIPVHVMQLLESRADFAELLKAEEYVDLVIPRGSSELVRTIQDSTRIPVLGHAEGICHIYVDEAADLNKALAVIIDSKIQYPSACNSVETVLLHESVVYKFAPVLVSELIRRKVETRADNAVKFASASAGDDLAEGKQLLVPATDKDWDTEYGELIVSIKSVPSFDDAVAHINQHGSHHTESIITENPVTAERFFNSVNSAGVFLNASTRFADGFRYGFGAEVGISTGKLHPRGPVGIEGLVTYKYKLIGNGHVVADYVGDNAKQFTHKDLL